MEYPAELRDLAIKLLGEGLTIARVAEKCNVSITTIRRWKDPVYHEKNLQAHKNWKQKNPEKMAAAQRQWRWNHPETAKAKDKRHYERKYAKYPYKYHQRAAKYRSRKRCSTFTMSGIEKMMCDNYYKMAKELTKQTGIKHHVDHIWPISRGGPHLPWNLRVITAEENLSKGARI